MLRRVFLSTLLFGTGSVKADVIFHGTSSPVKKKPQIWLFSTCPSCRIQAEKEINAEKDSLEFEVVHKNEKPPARLDTYDDPTFWWAKDTDQPDQSKQSTKVLGGWYGLKHLKEEFRKSRGQVKKQAGSPAKVPFAQPDQVSSRAVARTGLVYNPSHNCPTCGKVQTIIQNDAGPNHTHQCGNCSTVWYHADKR